MNCRSVSLITFCNLLTSSVRRYSRFFMSVSSSSLYIKIFLSSAVQSFFRILDKLSNTSTRGKQWLTLVRSFLLFELLLVCSPLHLELFSEFEVRFLERAVLCSFIGEALFQGSKFLVTTHNGFQSLRFLLGVGDCGRTNLNYTGSSMRVHSRGLQRTSNGITPWPVG
jgi:hypothetical protein